MRTDSWQTQDGVTANIIHRLFRVTKQVIDQAVTEQQCTADASFFDLGLVSLNVVELLSAVEEEFDIVVDENDLSAELFMRFGNVVELVRSKLIQMH